MKTRLLKNIAVISVRCNSKRLPNKSLKNYNGISILDRIIMNVKKSRHVNKIIVATSKKSSDSKIYDYCKKKHISCFRGDELNLIKRFDQACKKYNPKTVVRLTGDNPFVSHEIIDFMYKRHIKKKAEFSYMDRTNMPSGICPELINFSCFSKLLKTNCNFNFSEYMSFYFTNNPNFFHLNKIKPLKIFEFQDYKLRLTIDYQKDFLFYKKLIDLLGHPRKSIKLSKIYEVVRKNPNIVKINKNLKTKWRSKDLINKIKKASIIL